MIIKHRNTFYKLLLLLCCFLHGYHAVAQTASVKVSQWHGFQKNEFSLQGAQGYFVAPEKPLPGNPWVWRAHFPDWHIAIDSILLSRGFHVAYINTNDLFGHPKAMMLWDDFYHYLVDNHHFAPKVALEGVSRGGLYVYGWAKRNPDKVSCIYAEAPVCDFTSWPGGKGTGIGASPAWEKLLGLYGFTEEEALRFSDQPKDNLEALAAFKVPVYHAIGLEDQVVPVAENTFALAENYAKLGGPATIYPMTRGKQALEGHHFPIENPELIADFIEQHTLPVAYPLKKDDFVHQFGGLSNLLYKIKVDKTATVAFLGGSITANKGWRNKVCQFLEERFPETQFQFIHAGIPSLGSLPHAFRLEQDVLDKGKIDLLFVESAVNDYANSTPEQTQRRALEGIIRHSMNKYPDINIILMAFADEFKLADYKAGKHPTEVKVHQELAVAYQLPFINLAEEVYRRIEAGEFTWAYDFKDLHPSPFGQTVYYQTIKYLLREQLLKVPPKGIEKVKLSKPLEKENYAQGRYLNIAQAQNKDGFTLHPSWTPEDSASTRAGFVQVPMWVGTEPGAAFELPFEGNVIGMAVAAGPDAGIIQYSIDGGPAQKIDLFTQWSGFLHIPWYHLFTDKLSAGKHQLTVTIANEKNEASTGNACRIVYFLVNDKQ